MNAQSEVPMSHPMRAAWEAYKQTDDYANTRKWALDSHHVDGSLWAAFVKGYEANPAPPTSGAVADRIMAEDREILASMTDQPAPPEVQAWRMVMDAAEASPHWGATAGTNLDRVLALINPNAELTKMKNDPANCGHAESCACLRPGDAMCNCGQIYDQPTPADESGADDPGEFGAGIQPNPKARYWQQRAAFWRETAKALGYVPPGEATQPRAADESGVEGRGPMRAWVGDMKTSAGMDYYVCVGWPSASLLDKTHLTPRMYKIRGRAEYDVAEWNHLLGHCEKPDILAFDNDPTPEPRAAAQEDARSTHHVHRGPESLPCYCAGNADHPIGQEVNGKSLALAVQFHDTYERLAPSFGYETRTDTKRFDADSANGRLMVSVCGEILARLAQPAGDLEDAARWRALIGSARVRVLGSAGLCGEQDPYGKPWNDYAHIGIELWTKHGHAVNEPTDAVEWVTKYADAARRARGEGNV